MRTTCNWPFNAAHGRGHSDGMELGLPDGSRADELLIVLAMSRDWRIHDRMGGLTAGELTGGWVAIGSCT